MPVQSSCFHNSFSDLAQIFDDAQKKDLQIEEAAIPLLVGAVASFAMSQSTGANLGKLPDKAIKAWTVLLNQKPYGALISLDDIWKWIEKFLPDPISATKYQVSVE